MASKPKRKPVMKPMFFKKDDLSAYASKLSQPPPPPVALKASSSNTIDLTSPTPSQDFTPSGSQDPKNIQVDNKKQEVNDLDFWGRAKDVHASMQKVSEERRQEAKARKQTARSALVGKAKEKPTRSSKRRKSDENTVVLVSDGENNDEKDADYLPRKTTRDPALTPRASVEPVELDPSEFDKILEAFNKKKAEVEAEVAAKARAFSPPMSQLPGSQPATSTEPVDTSKDIVIQVLIISSIPGTKPMVFNRKFGQTLGKVRDTWARMQGFTEEQVEGLILVWQNKTRVFDSTLPKSLGIRFDEHGKMYLSSKGEKERKDESQVIPQGIAPEECRIFFDAMWVDEYEELMKRREAAKERENALELSSDSEGDDNEIVTGIALNTQMIEITLKGKHFKELKLKVKPSMKISEVIEKMRDERQLDEDTEIELHFDGEEIEEDMTLEEADIEDEFQIDVVLR
ncbi:hypothetical protein TWF730_008791 [Orbilia blumenaviensis]|uniref:Ubiquitin-like domain-containing protein n=1 Tax=Orbilia blumenaviensis TaxID=1796055 RepID=A0AAV9V516_9PEZI